jgi:hypothetical protein
MVVRRNQQLTQNTLGLVLAVFGSGVSNLLALFGARSATASRRILVGDRTGSRRQAVQDASDVTPESRHKVRGYTGPAPHCLARDFSGAISTSSAHGRVGSQFRTPPLRHPPTDYCRGAAQKCRREHMRWIPWHEGRHAASPTSVSPPPELHPGDWRPRIVKIFMRRAGSI